MPGTMVRITSDGVHTRTGVKSVNLKTLQEGVGGHIEIIPYLSSFVDEEGRRRACVAFCNEDGKNLGLPRNRVATDLWYLIAGRQEDFLVGDIIILYGDPEFMRSL